MYAYLHAHVVTASLHLNKGRTTRKVEGEGVGQLENAEKNRASKTKISK